MWGSAIGGGALGGAAGNLAGQAVDNATGRKHGLNLKSVAKDAIIGGALGAALHAAGPFLQKVFCFDGDTPVQVAPQAAQVAQVAMVSTSSSSGKKARGKTASLGLSTSSTKKIKDMKPGDVIVSRNARTGQVEYKKVLAVSRSIADRLVAVAVADKRIGKVVETIRATPEHPFFTTHGLVPAENLGIGTELVTRAGPSASGLSSTASGSGLVVKAVTPVPATVGKGGKRAGFVVYNLEVEDDHTYFVGDTDGGAWVHNDCSNEAIKQLRREGEGLIVRVEPADPRAQFLEEGGWGHHDVMLRTNGTVYDPMRPSANGLPFDNWVQTWEYYKEYTFRYLSPEELPRGVGSEFRR